MNGRWIPFFVTTAALALAAVAPAQSRSRGGGESRSSRSSGGDSRSSRGGGDSRPSRSSETRTDSRPSRSSGESRNDARPSRSSDDSRLTHEQRPSRSNDQPPRSGGDTGRPTQTNDRPSQTTGDRPSRQSGDTNPSRNGDRPSRGDNPILRPSRGDNGDSRPSRNDSRNDDRRDGSTRNGRSDRDVVIRGSNNRIVLGDRNDAFVRNRPSRSGTVHYGTVHNGYGEARPVRYNGGYNRSALGVQIRRNQPSVGVNVNFNYGGVYGGLRYGYVGYNRGWRDDYFAYPFYVFDPFVNTACVASPWYRYSYLPPYLDNTRVVVVNNYSSSWNDNDGWRDYDYRESDRQNRNENLNNALDDIRDAFERNSDRYGERLLPQSGQVAIFNEGKYDYSLGADDFQDMFLDGIEQSKTVKYEIVESRVKGDEVHLRARHEYTDSWDATQVVFHTYTLRREGDRYVIREFGTD